MPSDKYGHWIYNDNVMRWGFEHEYYICSECGDEISDRYGLYPYCPYCGAKMAVENEDD